MERRYLLAFWDAMDLVYGYPWRNGKQKEHELTGWYKLFNSWEITLDELRQIVSEHQQSPQQYAPAGADIRRQLVGIRQRQNAKNEHRKTVKCDIQLEMERRAELFKQDNLKSIADCEARAARYLNEGI